MTEYGDDIILKRGLIVRFEKAIKFINVNGKYSETEFTVINPRDLLFETAMKKERVKIPSTFFTIYDYVVEDPSIEVQVEDVLLDEFVEIKEQVQRKPAPLPESKLPEVTLDENGQLALF